MRAAEAAKGGLTSSVQSTSQRPNDLQPPHHHRANQSPLRGSQTSQSPKFERSISSSFPILAPLVSLTRAAAHPSKKHPMSHSIMYPLTPRPLPSPQHGRSPLVTPPPLSPRSPTAEDWWRWPTPTKEDDTDERPFREIGAEGRERVAQDGGRVKMLGEWRVGGTVGKGTSELCSLFVCRVAEGWTG